MKPDPPEGPGPRAPEETRGEAPPRATGPESRGADGAPGPSVGGAPPGEAEDRTSCPEMDPDRRRFLTAFVAGAGATAGAALLVPWTAMFVTPLREPNPDAWHPVGSLEDFPVGETRKVVYRDVLALPWAGFAARNAAWVRREADDVFSAFTGYCTHVGCLIRWEEPSGLFFCPCHGGAFHADGSVAAGPPPRALDRHPIRVRDGRVEIQGIGTPERSG